MHSSIHTGQTGLYRSEFEHDACGVGFIVDVLGRKSHNIVEDGLKILCNLEHRGAVGSDPKSGDGAGLLVQMPDIFLRKKCEEIDIYLPAEYMYGAGIVFLPQIAEDRHTIEYWFEQIIHDEGMEFLGWRDVHTEDDIIGDSARSVQPVMKQIFIGKGKNVSVEAINRKLFVIRKRVGIKVRSSKLDQKNFFYVCSLSTNTMVYKGQLTSSQLGEFFHKDLSDPDFVSALALVHSRYSTNTFPSWALAHPYRLIAHNGEINTLRGNKNWITAREPHFKSELLGDDLKKIIPVTFPDRSDSATFDTVLELLMMGGRPLPHALMMMIPEAYSHDPVMDEDKKAFYQYHASLMEPWGGPAAISFSDGKSIGAILDRNGLRPARYWVTKDGRVILSSESGVLPIDPANISEKGRLSPGKMLLVDLEQRRIMYDAELKEKYAKEKPYGQWVKENLRCIDEMPEPKKIRGLEEKTLARRQAAFGYTIEDLKLLLKPMALDGIEATGSMGNDTPLAALSNKPQLLYNYFKQMFAQVTNPPVDPIREEVIMSSEMLLGPERNLLTATPEHCRRLKIDRPVISNKTLEQIRRMDETDLSAATIAMCYKKKYGIKGMVRGLKRLFKRADEEIENGKTLLILSDRMTNDENVPIPALLACSGLHHYLIRNGKRTRVSIILETGEAREMHHFAVLIGYGANAINPYLAFESIAYELQRGAYESDITIEEAIENYLKATRKGLLKIISKMGISTIQSYCGAQIFEAVGLSDKLIDRFFTATVNRIGGIGLIQIAKDSLARHERGYGKSRRVVMDEGGEYAWRSEGAHHQLNPDTIAKLQQAVRSGDYRKWKEYSDAVTAQYKDAVVIRGLLDFKKRWPVPVEEVEPETEIVKRFATGAMSYGSISKEAHETIAKAMNKLGAFSNTGEGGEDPVRFKKDPDGSWRRSRIKQIAQGRFGVTIDYLTNADQLQIKMAQGAKPGEGGQLPGHKVSSEIARVRHTTPGVGLISPPPHHDIYSIEDLAQLIYDLKNSNPEADVSVKLVSEAGVGTVAAGVSKGKADHVLISGYEGGTGASPQTSIKHAGLPMELGIAETQQVLVMNDLRRRIRVQVDGQLKTGRDVVLAGMLGADEFGFSTSALVSLGCVLLRKCHLNTCSVGIATQDENLRKKFTGEVDHLVNFFMFIAREVREIMASMGIRKFDDLVGKVEYLEVADTPDWLKERGLDLSSLIHRPDVPAYMPVHNDQRQEHNLDDTVDKLLIKLCRRAFESGVPVRFGYDLNNTNRAVGTMLSSHISRTFGENRLMDDTIQIDFNGNAGQSFGAFLAKGVTFYLEGDANDYTGKGLSGGKLILFPPKHAGFEAEKNIIAGNVALYGATSGEVYLNGTVGERFAVRNSGAKAVVEGIGDHGCEYMTGGTVIILGPTGRNFGAGMSGGIAYVLDEDGAFERKVNKAMVGLYTVEDQDDLWELKHSIEKHLEYTGSKKAAKVLENWGETAAKFIKVYPNDYRKIIEEQKRQEKAGSASISA